ncbi:hypothetical protein K3495_g5128 [Podosphaera aphanis]|nr:hypothetical protein K3495_g5128 [Podosphaera aphanis]
MFKDLRTFSCYAQNDWVELLPMAQLALDTRPNSAIVGMSPFFLRHGYDINPIQEPTTEDILRHPGNISANKYVRRLKNAQDFAQAALATVQQRNEENANRSRR